MSDSNEKTDLEQLLQSAGWLRLLELARQRWKEQLPGRLAAAAELQPLNASTEVLKILYAANEINQLLSWPKERLAVLERSRFVESLARGGYETQTPR